MKLLRKNKKEMLEIKDIVEVKTALDGLITRLDTAEEIINELEDK